jgi:hypothetical protein
MPDAAISTASATSTAAPVTGGDTSTAEPKITYGSPEGDTPTTDTQDNGGDDLRDDGTEGEGLDDFGELDAFGDDAEDSEALSPEKFSSEQYKALKTALAANPELFKAVKREISENSRYKQVFDSPEAAREATDKIDALGGLESIEQESQEWAKVEEMFSRGDKAVLDYWAKDHPQAIAKLFPHVYDRVAELDPQGWAYKAAGTFMATAQQQGMIASIETLAAMPAIANSPEAKNLVAKIVESFNKINAVSQHAPTSDLTPEAKTLADKEKSLKEQETSLYHKGVSQQVVPLLNKQAVNALSAVLKGRKLGGEAQKALRSDVIKEYSALAQKDATFQKNAKALLANNETEKFIKLVTSNISRTMPLAAAARVGASTPESPGLGPAKQLSARLRGRQGANQAAAARRFPWSRPRRPRRQMWIGPHAD